MATILLPVLGVAVAAWLLIKLLIRMTKQTKLDMPYLKFNKGDNSMQQYHDHSGEILERGYQQYLKKGEPHSMFNCMDGPTPMAVLPPKYLQEVRNTSSTKLSFAEFMNEFTVAKDIGAPLVTDTVTRAVRQDLNRSLNEMIEPIQQVVGAVFGMLLPPSADFTPVNAHMFLLQLISQVMARIFVGPELCFNPEWHAVVLAYSQAGHAAAQRVREQYRPWLRWTAKYFDSDVKAIYAARRKGEALLKPLVEARLLAEREKADGQGAEFNDGIRWLIDAHQAERKPVTVESIMQDEIFVVAASVQSSAMTTFSILLDLIDRPDSLAEIRHEISEVYAEFGSWTRQALGSLRTMDSFMKESQRLHTSQYMTMQRRALEDVTFKDGLRIPAGTSIFMPSRLLSRDPDVHANGAEFDAKRWKRMREEGDATKFHFASLQDNMIPWGSGPHACPGRFLVQEIVKCFLIHVVTKYDVKYLDGVDSRPADVPSQTSSFPDTTIELLFKER